MSSHKIEPELCPCAGGRGLPGLGASGGQRADRGPGGRMGSHGPTAQRLPGVESGELPLLQALTRSRYRIRQMGGLRSENKGLCKAVYYSITQRRPAGKFLP